MIGAILGDVVGSRFEFNNIKSKNFNMFERKCTFTDDTVMTLAVAKALMKFEKITDIEEFKKELIATMHEVGGKYPYCGYGGNFRVWIKEKLTEPYNSYGNGSAMRVSPVAWYANSLKECEALAAASAEVTHNHPEGIKGAAAVAGAIYIARTTHSMAEIKEYIKKFYIINFTLDEIRDSYVFYVTCQNPFRRRCRLFLNQPILRTR